MRRDAMTSPVWIEVWGDSGIQSKVRSFFDVARTDRFVGCTSDSCGHVSHDPAAWRYRLTARSGVYVRPVLWEHDEDMNVDWFLVYRQRPSGLPVGPKAILKVARTRQYHSVVKLLRYEEAPERVRQRAEAPDDVYNHVLLIADLNDVYTPGLEGVNGDPFDRLPNHTRVELTKDDVKEWLGRCPVSFYTGSAIDRLVQLVGKDKIRFHPVICRELVEEDIPYVIQVWDEALVIDPEEGKFYRMW